VIDRHRDQPPQRSAPSPPRATHSDRATPFDSCTLRAFAFVAARDEEARMVDRVLRGVMCISAALAACGDSKPGAGDSPDAPTPTPAVDASIDAAPDPEVPPDAAVDTRVRKALVIGVDGVRHDKLALATIPAMRALAARGILEKSWIFGAPMAGTWSGPSWSSIATGVWPDRHRVFDNDFRNHALAQFPDFLSRLEAAQPDRHTYVIGDWKPITEAPGPVFGPGVDTRVMHDGYAEPSWPAADIRVTSEAVEALRAPAIDAAFVYLGNVDVVGHSGDTDLRYLAAIEAADRQIGQLVAAVEARATYADESWLIIVTTDHGHRDGGNHGGNSWQERQSFILAAGGDIGHDPLPFEPRIVDIAPTVLAHMGVAIDPAWNLDGVPLRTPSTDPFDTVAPRLRAALDEDTVPGLGWTHDTPAGWTIDNRNMDGGGTAEWRGWSFATTEFWMRTEVDQSRESFVRGRGVIAVADSDEWDDGMPTGDKRFSSTLQAPPVAVTAGSTVKLRFVSHYLQERDQKGQVLISFDGRAPEVLLQYGPGAGDRNRGGNVISSVEVVPIQVPMGIRQIYVSWKLYDAVNNWYWAIDDPRIEM
jgi:hypothetical protein